MLKKHLEHYFLSKGGEMGALIRDHNWSDTPLGSPETWPPCLRTMVAVMLNNPFAMYIAWGSDYTQLYNDAYRPILGLTKHPHALGNSTSETFEEIWHIIGPMFDGVMKGNAIGFPGLMLPLNRNGFVEECYFDFSYSPIIMENGEVGGVLVTVIETTGKRKMEEELVKSEERFRSVADNIPNLAWMARADGWIYWYNKKWYEYTGTTPEQMEGWGWQSVHDPRELPLVTKQWQKSLDDSLPFEMIFPLKGVDGRYRKFLTRVLPVRNNAGEIVHWFGSNTDITFQIEAEEALKVSQERFHNTVKQVPVGITILRGKEFMVEMANDAYLRLIDKKEHEFVGRLLFDSLPEVKESVHPLLENVLATGVPFHGVEYPIPINRYGKLGLSYFDFLYHPLKETDGTISGIIVTVTDVSTQVLARLKVEESDQKLRSLVKNAPFPIGVLVGRELKIELANEAIIKTWGKGKEVTGKLFKELLPELASQQIFEQMEEVFETGIPYHVVNRYVHLVVDGKDQAGYFNYSFIPLLDPSGEVYGIMNTAVDVTDLNLAKRKIEESEQRFRNVADSAPVLIWMSGTDKLCWFFNNGWLNFTGRTMEQEVGNGWIEGVHPDDLERCVDVYVSFFEKRQPFYMEYRLRRHDGEYRWISDNGVPRFTSDGDFEGYIGACMDITIERTHQKELEESEQKFRLLADSMPQHIWTSDTEGNLNYFNQSVFNYSGLTLEEINGGGWIQIVHPDDRPGNVNVWKRSITTGTDFLYEHRFRRYDGEYRWQLSRAIPQKDENGIIQMWVGTSTDIQDQKVFVNELEEQVQKRTRQLAQNNMELEKMNKELQSFAYISSHDLQEPLRKIQTFSSQIMEKESHNLSDKGRDRFARIQNAAKRMQILIEDLLSYSKTNTAERKFETTDLRWIVEEVKEDLKEELEQKKATIEAEELCEVKIIPFQFRQLLYNLISNSLKFSRANTAPRIVIECKIVKRTITDDDGLAKEIALCHISVSDNGIGFEQKYNEKIFEVFQRLHGKDEYNGTGIGLAIVKKIVENHFGTITAKGELGKGARFDIFIPAE